MVSFQFVPLMDWAHLWRFGCGVGSGVVARLSSKTSYWTGVNNNRNLFLFT